MMMSEFTERTGFEPTAKEYTEIEEAYYRFDGDKNAFCKHWMETVGIKGICKDRAEKAAELRSTMMENEKELMKTIAEKDKRIAELEAMLEREQEWKPHEDAHNVKQADYEELARASDSRELSDDEAVDMIASEFGFDRSKIVIAHDVAKEEINRHGQCRRVGTIPRKALFNAWDWNYIVFNVNGNTTMGYEMHNGQIQMYWG